MTRTVWTSGEKDAIFARMEQHFRAHPNEARKEALRAAQSVLNFDRRIVVTDQRVFNYRDRIEIARQKAIKWREKVPTQTVEAPAPIPTPPPEPERKETPTERLASIFEQLLDILADKVADRLADRMADIPARQFVPGVSLTDHRPRHNPEPVSQPRLMRPGVLVLGMLPQTGEPMRREFGHRLDIQWYDSNDASKRNVHPMANVGLMTKFINHSIQERWRKAGVLHYCNGGASELRQILASL